MRMVKNGIVAARIVVKPLGMVNCPQAVNRNPDMFISDMIKISNHASRVAGKRPPIRCRMTARKTADIDQRPNPRVNGWKNSRATLVTTKEAPHTVPGISKRKKLVKFFKKKNVSSISHGMT